MGVRGQLSVTSVSESRSQTTELHPGWQQSQGVRVGQVKRWCSFAKFSGKGVEIVWDLRTPPT